MSTEERQPLLTINDSGYLLKEIPKGSWFLEIDEFKTLFKSAIPLSFGFLLEAFLGLSSVAIAGRLSSTSLAVVGNGIQITSTTAYVVTLACTSAQLTLSGPLFYSKDHAKTDIGMLAQRSFMLALICSIPLVFLYWNIGTVLLFLDQPQSLADGCTPYFRWAILTIPAYALMEVVKSYLQTQQLMSPATWIVGAVLPIHVGLSIFLIHFTPLGASGAALGLAISQYLVGFGLIGYIYLTGKGRECWGGFDSRAFNGWLQYLKLVAPGVVMYGSEWWAFEVVSLVAGTLGELPVAAQAGLSSLDVFLTMIPYSISVACTARLGNLLGLGARAIPRTKALVTATIWLELSIASFIAIILFSTRSVLGYAFTDHKDVVALISSVLIPVAAYQLWDGLQGVGAGILKATGRQNLAAAIHIVAYYFLAIPVGYLLAFKANWGLFGLWSAQCMALFLIACTELSIYKLAFHWDVEIEKAHDRSVENMD